MRGINHSAVIGAHTLDKKARGVQTEARVELVLVFEAFAFRVSSQACSRCGSDGTAGQIDHHELSCRVCRSAVYRSQPRRASAYEDISSDLAKHLGKVSKAFVARHLPACRVNGNVSRPGVG